MLKTGLIEFTRHPSLNKESCNEVLVGRLEVGATLGITEFEREHAIDFWRRVKNQVRQKIWHNTYGEIYRPLRELKDRAMFEARDSEAAHRIAKEFDAILALLEYPKIADETPDSPKMAVMNMKKGHRRISP